MLIDERKRQILDITKEKTFVSVEDLSKSVYASPATIRRDLVSLAEAGLIKRVRGGASVISSSTGEVSVVVRKQTNVLEKRRMAIACLPFIQEGDSYFLDSSTTVNQLIPFLKKFTEITVITNGFENAFALSTFVNFPAYIAGGSISTNVASSTGADTIDYLRRFSCNTFIFSCRGFSLTGGATEGTIEQQRVKSVMLANSSFHILLCDHSKFDKTLLARDCPLSDIDVIITDALPSQVYIDACKTENVKLIVANQDYVNTLK
jgi:DeoR family transcriptional regulator, carbon catabolite repression regulator